MNKNIINNIYKVLWGTFYCAFVALIISSMTKFWLSKDIIIAPEIIDNVLYNVDFLSNMNVEDLKESPTASSTMSLNNWELIATIIGSPSYAMLNNGSKYEVLKIGDTLEKFILENIYKDKVMFVKDEESHLVYIKGSDIKNTQDNQMPSAKKTTAPSSFLSNKNEFKKTIKKSKFDSYMQNPEKLLNTAKIKPYIKNGVFKGFSITGIQKSSFLHQYAGLQKGDIITGINGAKFRSVSDALRRYKSITKSNNFSLDIIRADQYQSLRYDVVR